MTAEARERAEHVHRHYVAAAQELRRAREIADELGGSRRPVPLRLLVMVETAAAALALALHSDTPDVYIVCGAQRLHGARCTRERGHTGECSADYSARYHRADAVGLEL